MLNYIERDDIINTLNTSNSLEFIKKWKFDKLVYLNKNEKVSKIEIYNYIDRDNLKKLIKHLQTKRYKYTSDNKIMPKIFSILLSKNKKHTSWQWKIIKDISNTKYYYYVDFVKAIVHRGSIFLIKIYRNESIKSSFSKIELSYYYNDNSKYNLYYWTWVNSLKWLNEIIKRLSYKFDFIWYDEDFSKKIDFFQWMWKILSIYPKNKIKKESVKNFV